MQAELLAALAALSWAVGSLFSAAASSQMGAFAFTRWRLFFALTLLWALALFTGQWRTLDSANVALLALSGFMGIEAVGADTYNMGAKTTGSILVNRMKLAGS